MANRTGYTLAPNTDRFTGFDVALSGDHSYIHEGKAFSALIALGSISAAYKISFTTPANKYIHWRPAKITTSAAYVDSVLYEGDAYSAGSAVTPINRNRNSLAASTLSMVKGSTVTPAGTIIELGGVGTEGNPAAQGGGAGGAEHELVLKPGTKYTRLITPSAATVVTVTEFWYEEDVG